MLMMLKLMKLLKFESEVKRIIIIARILKQNTSGQICGRVKKKYILVVIYLLLLKRIFLPLFPKALIDPINAQFTLYVIISS